MVREERFSSSLSSPCCILGNRIADNVVRIESFRSLFPVKSMDVRVDDGKVDSDVDDVTVEVEALISVRCRTVFALMYGMI